MKLIYVKAVCLALMTGAIASLVIIGNQRGATAQRRVAGKPATGTLAPKPIALQKMSQQDGRNVFRSPLSADGKQELHSLFAESDKELLLARKLFEQGDFENAKARCLHSAETAPLLNGKPFIRGQKYLMGEILLAQRQYKEALEQFISVRPNRSSGDVNPNIALCYIRLGNVAEARRYYDDQSILQYNNKLSSDDLPGIRTATDVEASILASRGTESKMTGQYSKALADFEPASKLAPKNAWIWYMKAGLLRDEKRYAEAIAAFDYVVALGNSPFVNKSKDYSFILKQIVARQSVSASKKMP